MDVSSYKTFIQSLDVCNIKVERKNRSAFWKNSMEADDDVNSCITSLINANDVYSVSRNDIFSEDNETRKVIKALYWGYPSLRKKDCADLSKILASVLPFLTKSKNKVVRIKDIYTFKETCSNLNLPQGAYSKFLYFFRIRYVNDKNCLIVDRFLEAGLKEFSDFDNVGSDYFDICKKIHSMARSINVSSEQLEYFLFFIGRHSQYKEKAFRMLLDLAVNK